MKNKAIQKTKKRSEWIYDATGQNYLIPEFYINQDGDLDRANSGWALYMSLVAPKTQNFFIFYFSIDGCPVEGKFKFPLTVPEANSILVISYVGFASQEVTGKPLPPC